MQNTPVKSILSFIVLVAIIAVSATGLFETNDFGNYQVKQAIFSGEMSVRSDAGMYWRGFGKITTYTISEDIDFSAHNIEVRFNDGSVAKVIGTVKFRLPTGQNYQLALHRDYGDFKWIVEDLIVKNVKESLSQAATLMPAEESYSNRRGEFAWVAEQQLKLGIFETTSKEVEAINSDGTKFRRKVIEIAYDKNSAPIVKKPSLLNMYGIEILQFVINDFKYDPRVEEMISRRKEFENLKVVAATEAETAKQNAITEAEQGKARVAKAEADALVIKKTAVIQAEKEAEIARLDAIRAQQEAIAIKARGEAEAHANKLKVQAGLTPLEKAEIEMKTADLVSKNLASVRFPATLIIGGGGKDGAMNPFDAIGLNSFFDLSKKVSQSTKISD